MPVPILLAGIAATGLFSAKKAYDASKRNEKARRIAEDAEDIADDARREAQAAKEHAGETLTHLGRRKAEVLTRTMPAFLCAFEQLHHIELSDSQGVQEAERFRLQERDLPRLQELGELAQPLVTDAESAAVKGGVLAFGAYGGVGLFGTASSGAAISGLSGAAATNATLAWFGGGSLAAGGLGVAGGTAVFGGLVAAPIAAIVCMKMDARSRENLARAHENRDRARAMAAQLATVRDLCDGITARSDMFVKLIDGLEAVLLQQTGYLYHILRAAGTDYRTYNMTQKSIVARALSAAGALKAAIDTPILNEDGTLAEASQEQAEAIAQEAVRMLSA